MVKHRIYLRSAMAVIVVAGLVHLMARPVPGVGIAEPTFMPSLVTASVVLVLSRKYAAPLAYIAGSLGTLIGADLMNLGRIRGLGAPVASIGGAGTFDGIFLAGILAVLLASFLAGGPQVAGIGLGGSRGQAWSACGRSREAGGRSRVTPQSSVHLSALNVPVIGQASGASYGADLLQRNSSAAHL